MPIQPPALDDRSFADLVDEVLARVPAHTPEWTNPRVGDPGRTLVELFAWLTDTLLYRANLVPERQRLAFLRLLGAPMQPAAAARGVVSIFLDEDAPTVAVPLAPYGRITGPVVFETRTELTVFPVTAEGYRKRPLGVAERVGLGDVLLGLQSVYRLDGALTPYQTTAVFPGGAADAGGFDLITDTVDGCLWLALLAAKAELVPQVKQALGKGAVGRPLLNVGVVPALRMPDPLEDVGPDVRVPHVWEVSTGRLVGGQPEYLPLAVAADSTAGLVRPGVLRLTLPAPEDLGALSNDVRQGGLDAGVGDRPPRLDDADQAARLVTWLRLRPTVALHKLLLNWVGVNAVEIDQYQTLSGRVVGQSDGSADQQMPLPGQSVEAESFVLQVEETGRGYQTWQAVDDLLTAGRDQPAFSLDSEAGTVRFGDGVHGRIPENTRRVRVARMRAGGGAAGNLPAGSLTAISAAGPDGRPVTRKLKVAQPLPTDGGADAETLDRAEQRIPATFRHGNRAVTEEDFRRLAAAAPGVQLGRVEVMANFMPVQRRSGVPGVVSVMALPYKAEVQPPNPRPDRPFLQRVHAYLDARRPVATELHTIGCEYIPVAASVAVTLLDGFGQEEVLNAVRDALRQYLWPLPPGGPAAAGWPLGRAVRDRELEVVVARVPGVDAVAPVNLFTRSGDSWQLLPHPGGGAVSIPLQPWQLPELLAVAVVATTGADSSPTDLRGVLDGTAPAPGVAVPVVPDVC